VSPLNDGCLLD
ncbi:hypothetical protein V3C99_002416, partial [Haemonchus contortus]